MEAHPQAEAAEPTNVLDEILELSGIEPDKPEEEEPTEDPAEEGEEGDEPTDDAEEESDEDKTEGEEDEGAEPKEVIKPPVSLNKDQKAAFAQLAEASPELAKVWAESEAQRNREVQIKTTEAAEATRNATTAAQAQVAEVSRHFASQLEVYAKAFIPTEPDISLLATDPVAYAQEVALSRQMQAQHDELMQQVAEIRGGATQLDQAQQQQDIASNQAILREAWPEILDPSQSATLWQGIVEVGADLGFTPELLNQANATEMLALRKAQGWKAKAAKWDAHEARKMANVRAAKELPRAAKPGTSPSRQQSKAGRADAAWKRAQSSRSPDDFADFLENSGISLT